MALFEPIGFILHQEITIEYDYSVPDFTPLIPSKKERIAYFILDLIIGILTVASWGCFLISICYLMNAIKF